MRHPVVAGTFYPGTKAALSAEIKKLFENAGAVGRGEGELLAVVVPHAGYMYSGGVATFAYASIAAHFSKPPVFVILGPNHTGAGFPLAISQEDWQTPLGIAKNDRELGNAIVGQANEILADESAHMGEHSIEVQLPFLQHVYGDVKFVPVCMMDQTPSAAGVVGNAVFEAAGRLRRDVLVIASSDFTHFEQAEVARKKDGMVMERIEKIDYEGVHREIMRNNVSVCGYGPIMAAMVYAKRAGCKKIRLLKYANSGDVTGDYRSVVGYASFEMVG